MIEVRQEDRDAALAIRNIVAGQLRRVGIEVTVKPPADDSDEVQAFAAHRKQAEDAMRERCAKHLERRANKVDPPGGKRVAMVDQHTASVLRANATAIRGIDAGGEGE